MAKEIINGEEQEVKGEGKYLKICKQCNNWFRSDSRGTRYCSEECCDKAQGRNKTRRRRRKEYDKNRESNLMLSTAYSLAHRVAELFGVEKNDNCSGSWVALQLKMDSMDVPQGSGDWELHHKDCNPLNNHPDNLIWLRKNHHSLLHSKMGKVNIISVLEGKDEASYDVKVSLLNELLEGFKK